MKTIIYTLTLLIGVLTTPLFTLAQCSPSIGNAVISNPNVSIHLNSASDLWWDFQKAGYEIPNGSNRTTTFAGGIWLAGKDPAGQLKIAVTQFRQKGVDFWPGPIDSNGFALNCRDYDRVWTMTKSEIDQFKQFGASALTNNIKQWPGKNNPNLLFTTDMDLAPFVDIDGDGNYNPNKGDYPKIKGHSAAYWVFNDKGNVHTESGGNALGIEVHVMAYLFNAANGVSNNSFYDYKIKYKGTVQLSDVHLGFFSDFDLGGPNDDFGGSDSAKQIAFIYNGDPFDEDSRSVLGYGANPPVAAIQTLKEPTIGSKSYPMSSCIVASNNINAETGKNASEMYNALQGLKTDGKSYLNKQGKPTRFMYEGQPDVSTNSECKNGNTSGDRRLLLGYGPMDLNPGEIIEYSNSNTFRRDLTPNYSTCGLGLMLDQVLDSNKLFFQRSETPSVGIIETIVSKQINVFPNPTRDQITISGIHEEVAYSIFSRTGQLMLSGNTHGSISLSSLKEGMYILRIEDRGNVTSKMIIKQ